jgi:tryptophan synthase alpha chain
MSRIAATFAALRANQRKALIPFITAGDPAAEFTVPLMHALVQAGADVIELGVPFSDPMADGPTIQRSSERALKHGVGLKHVIEMVADFRKTNDTTPVVLFGYANPIEAMGTQNFAQQAKAAGVDGVLVVDYPPEECADFAASVSAAGIDPIFLLSPTSSAERIQKVAQLARGYIYYVSLKGVTGAAHIDTAEVQSMVARIKARTDLPVGVGFGIRDGETARRVAACADAVVIGSRIVQEIESSTRAKLIENVRALVTSFRTAMDQP